MTGVVATTPDGPLRITAARGVVLAAGGFPHDVARRRALFPRTPTGTEHWSLAPKTADGAGTTLGESAGRPAAHGRGLPRRLVPGLAGALPLRPARRWRRTGVFPHIMDRAKPGSIGVLSTGRRFVNEADGYHDYVTAMIAAAPEGEPVQSWQIADARFVRRFPLGHGQAAPGAAVPYLRSGYLKKGRHARGARPGLRHRPGRPGGDRRRVQPARPPRRGPGVRPRAARRSTATAATRRSAPNPSLAPLEKGPFYAVRIVPGSFGTFAGLATDARARVLDAGYRRPGARPVRRGQRPGQRDGRALPGGRDQHRARRWRSGTSRGATWPASPFPRPWGQA